MLASITRLQHWIVFMITPTRTAWYYEQFQGRHLKNLKDLSRTDIINFEIRNAAVQCKHTTGTADAQTAAATILLFKKRGGKTSITLDCLLQATTAIVEKTVRAFYSTLAVVSTIAVVCCNHGLQHTSSFFTIV